MRFFSVLAWKIVLAAAAVALSVDSSDMPPGQGLDTAGSPNNNIDLLRISEEEIVFDHWNSTAENAKVMTCETAGGECMLKRTVKKKCNGKIDKKSKCDKKNYVCCISGALKDDNQDGCCECNMVEVSFASSEGIAKASSYYNNDYTPSLAFIRGGNPWCAEEGAPLPQSLWFEFLSPIILLKFSFTTREDSTFAIGIECGASKYFFWGSNNANCGDASNRVILFEDYSGIPFTRYNDPKMACIKNKNPYKCYGFTIAYIPSKNVACIDNVRFYAKPDRR